MEWIFKSEGSPYNETPTLVFSLVASATRENTVLGVHSVNKIRSYTEKIKHPLSLYLHGGESGLTLIDGLTRRGSTSGFL